MVWPLPYTCAQPYHPGIGSHGQLFRPYWSSSAWHSRRVNEGGKTRASKTFWAHRSIFSSHLHTWAPTMAKPLSVAATAWVIWLSTCTRSWYVCFSDWYWGDNPVWQTGLPTSVGHQTYHVNMNKLKWEIIWTGGYLTFAGYLTYPWSPPPPPPCKQALNLYIRTDAVLSPSSL